METDNKFATSALTLGILSIVFFVFFYISIPTGVLAIVFGSKSIRETKRKNGKPGFVTGIVGVSLCLALHITMIVLFSTGVLHF